jgi:hypothetical protein
MSNPKIVIEISGGNLQAVHANQDIDYILVDHDNLDLEGDDFDLSAYEADGVYVMLDEAYRNEGDKRSDRICEILKNLNW